MSIIRQLLGSIFLLSCFATAAHAQGAGPLNDTDAIARGRYLATAADCAACHAEQKKDGSPFGGGMPIASPMGVIFASNITPDKEHGIGNWTFEQFSDAVRKGRSPSKGYLYPAMPYTSYANMSDADVHAVYAYLMQSVAPSANQPKQTHLPFPFIRQAMFGWDFLFLHADANAASMASAAPGSVERGRYVGEALEHCSACHTPRNTLYAEDTSKLLSGAQVGNWYAPNITPDKTGIGNWSDAELVQFLSEGHNAHAVAGGDMGLAVSRSLSKLKPDDMQALVKYLRSVPAIATPGAAQAATAADGAVKGPQVNIASVEPQHKKDLATLTDSGSVDGARLFEASCASCHGASGGGSSDGQHPDLATNSSVLMHAPDNLIMTIVEGVHRNINGQETAMPGFASEFNDAQIAAIATYVRGSIGGNSASAITAADVSRARAGDVQDSWLIRSAGLLTIVALIVALIVLIAIVLFIRRSFARTRSSSH